MECFSSTFPLSFTETEGTFIEEGLVAELGLDGQPHPLCIRWTGETQREEKESVQVQLSISSVDNKERLFTLPKVHSIQKLSLPHQSFSAEQMRENHDHLKNLPLKSYTNASPRLLIGIDNCHLVQPLQYAGGKEQEPVAVKTQLGWVVFGPYAEISTPLQNYWNYHICSCATGDAQSMDTALRNALVMEFGELSGELVPARMLLAKRRFENTPPKQWRKAGDLTELYVYPFKSCAPVVMQSVQCANIGPQRNLLRDRTFTMTNADGEFVTARMKLKMMLGQPRFDECYETMVLTAPGMLELRVDVWALREVDADRAPSRATVWSESVPTVDCGPDAARWYSRYLLDKDDSYRLEYTSRRRHAKVATALLALRKEFPFQWLPLEKTVALHLISETFQLAMSSAQCGTLMMSGLEKLLFAGPHTMVGLMWVT
uniref:MOSC_N domain-containing protein n=1 Tax=Anopheles dirus TaxID=7168 RepID=A0A182NAQ7_9DIPT